MVLARFSIILEKAEAAHALVVRAARKKDSGERNDVEAGMATLGRLHADRRGHLGHPEEDHRAQATRRP
jgi:hypothetical protein